MTDESLLSKLYVPTFEKDDDGLKWRIELVRETGVIPIEVLNDLLSRAERNEIDRATKDKLVKLALSADMELDEVEKLMLFSTKMTFDVAALDQEKINTLEKLIQEFADEKQKWQFRQFHKSSDQMGNWQLKFLKKIRAKFAFKEIVASFAPQDIITHLVSFTPNYLACSQVQSWIKTSQFALFYGGADSKKLADEFFKKLNLAIRGDPRRSKRRIYAYWDLVEKYETLAGAIKRIRKHVKANQLNSTEFAGFCKDFKIPENYRTLILNSPAAPKLLALEIMTEVGDIDDPKAFKDFQSKVSKLEEKYSSEIIFIMSHRQIMDVPTKAPELLDLSNYLSVLEKVKLSMAIRPNS